ncbi:MAG: DUF4091 domain-containing protein [Planctomycetota bacterium]|nr:DUF4091 domain-containing protein [Planctomycetota bacterium]
MRMLGVVFAVLAGCSAAGAEGLRIQVCSDVPRIRQEKPWPEASPIYDAEKRAIRLHGARNEVLGFQILLRTEGEAVPGVALQVSGLEGAQGARIPASAFERFRAGWVQVETPSYTGDIAGLGKGTYADPLVPVEAPAGGAPFVLETGRTEVLWVDLYLPEGTPAGTYTGSLTLTSKDAELAKLALSVDVWNFSLPEQTHYQTLCYYETEFIRWAFPKADAETQRAIEADLLCLGRRHRINLATDTSLKATEEDWEKWAARYGRFMDGSAFTQSPGKGQPSYMFRLSFNPEMDEAAAKARLKLAADYLARKGWLDRFVVSCFDEPKKDKFPLVKRTGEWVREASGSRLKYLVPGVHVDPSLQDCVDVWDSVWKKDELGVLAERRKAGQRVWTYGGLGASANPCIDGSPCGNRSWAWVSWKYGFDGFEMWHSNYWVDKFNLTPAQRKDLDRDSAPFLNVWKNPAPLTFDEGRKRGGKRETGDILQNGSTTLFYPGTGAGLDARVIATVRTKDLRRGCQDYEYLWLLRQAGEEAVAEAAVAAAYLPDAPDLARGGHPKIPTGDVGVVVDEATWERVRQTMGRRLHERSRR